MRAQRRDLGLLLLSLVLVACERPESGPESLESVHVAPVGEALTTTRQRPPDDPFSEARAAMVRQQLAGRDITNPLVLAAMRRVERHAFVPEPWRDEAYRDRPLPIGEEQTISQPYIVALMTQLLELERGDRVLEIGTGSGYQAAVLAEIVDAVYTIEIVEPLGLRAAATLEALGYDDVQVRVGDGYQGWPEAAPFDAIIVTAAPERVPEPLIEQLAVGGRMVIPVGPVRQVQSLRLLVREEDGVREEAITQVRFVPMTGEAQGDAR